MNNHKSIRGLLTFPMITVCTVLISMLSGCISEFEPPENMQDRAGILVVEGMILEEGTTITLSRTVKLSEGNLTEFYLFDDINNAVIRIIDENQNPIATATQSYNYGPYAVNERISFVPDMKYAVDIRTPDNKHYQSAFVSPVRTPAIDEVNYRINDDYSIDIFVSTHDPANQTNFYRWEFEEDWEIRSKLFMEYRYDPNTQRFSIPQSPAGDNRYYCWASDRSRSFLFASTANYMEAVIRNHKIHSLEPDNSRYSYLYSILVKQYGLDSESYLYFENLQRNLDESGSIFAPQPSEMTGNIRCLSDPNETVIGCIFATEVTTYRLFIPIAQQHNLSYLEDQYDCTNSFLTPTNDATAFGWGLGLNSDNEYVSLRCLDCTFRGGTKTKPDFWPNDHQ